MCIESGGAARVRQDGVDFELAVFRVLGACRQIAAIIKRGILSGQYLPDTRIPTPREGRLGTLENGPSAAGPRSLCAEPDGECRT